jgi:hypothetical protein
LNKSQNLAPYDLELGDRSAASTCRFISSSLQHLPKDRC